MKKKTKTSSWMVGKVGDTLSKGVDCYRQVIDYIEI